MNEVSFHTLCVMKSHVAADFSAPDVAAEWVLCFMSGNVKAFLLNVLHVQRNNGYLLK